MAASPDLPILSLATSASRLVGLGTLLQGAKLAGLGWVDLDLTGRERGLKVTTLTRAACESGVGIRAVWLPTATPSRFGLDRSTPLARLTGELIAGIGTQAVVLDRPHGTPTQRAHQSRLLQAIRTNVPRGARLTFAIRPHELDGTREHLVGLAALRRVAEEWDVDLALDLHGRIDPAWESEAAVSKLLPRLTVVRIGPFEARPLGRGRAKQTARVLAFLADLGFRGAIAIAPTAPVWRPDRAIHLARSCRDATEAILWRYEAVRQDLRSDASTRNFDRL